MKEQRRVSALRRWPAILGISRTLMQSAIAQESFDFFNHRYHHQMDFSTQESQIRTERRRTFLVPSVSIAPSTVASRKVKDTPIKSGDRCEESVAVCLVGAARSFPSPIVQAAFLENFLKQLGTNVILFGLFKLTDTEKYSREIQFRRHVNDFRNVSAALASPTLFPWLRHGEAIILNGSGIPVADVRHFPGVHSEIVPSNESIWRSFKTSRCPRDPYLDQGTNEERLVNQHLAMRWCLDAIRYHESRTTRRFDVVVFSRPDAFWMKPAPSPCSVNASRQIFGCDGPGCDQFWMTPRRYAGLMLSQAWVHRDCSSICCCGNSEMLLRYVKQELSKHYSFELSSFIDETESPGWFTLARSFRDIERICTYHFRDVCQDLFLRIFNESVAFQRRTKSRYLYADGGPP